MSEHENGNFVLKCGQNQQKYQSFMAISDFALLYRIRRSGARYQLPSSINSSCGLSCDMDSIRRIFPAMRTGRLVSSGSGTLERLTLLAGHGAGQVQKSEMRGMAVKMTARQAAAHAQSGGAPDEGQQRPPEKWKVRPAFRWPGSQGTEGEAAGACPRLRFAAGFMYNKTEREGDPLWCV